MSTTAFYSTPRHKTREIAAQDKHTATVILMHGRGDQPLGLQSAWEHYVIRDNDALKHIKFVIPSAPVIKDPLYSQEVATWYDADDSKTFATGRRPPALIYDIEEQAERIEFASLMRSVRDVDLLVEQEAEILRGSLQGQDVAPEKRIVLAGFSQGAVMSIMTGLTGSPTPDILARKTKEGKVREEDLVREGKAREGWEVGGIAALSGYVPRLHEFRAMYSQNARNTPLFMAHVKVDNVVACSAGETSAKLIQELSGGEADIIDHSINADHKAKKSLIEVHQFGGSGHVYNEAQFLQLKEHLSAWLTRVVPPL
ncbi:alpha beta-hydrolase [Coniophora puteana RWD-64-598 SS2]|uniref:Acyl-protein thioesterase 1 n=1 Tax=Coniophora puteana (strain RWD-64-598) TaxID=741705 RepID=A0A5M3M912_CONPW|nr:alpha beta-hydrolase [Coniophora puteana RWD-64-598 SS2]EIW75245.1 alpha beta-hydrolase [Coniophora puteana RWD-64-598 SS2]